ncbi:uncharacterized protein BO87DRAFT_170165 [Aspergillus neoniger CBS 115656]|uniref:Uncharacterized protein n=1 Tax=Aspergillus neoniger (strain CBS 115656) TaxID=1448310 RepID=A0A318YP79_ASPNB|nr:hypothetical protein BO87DRAFT_170165 [Aspergillus neoniger CBS 115656]PYH29998.1 hypothetical protein BO87DRAFT_170165 [Aspergillus neoniger CBS 115656]
MGKGGWEMIDWAMAGCGSQPCRDESLLFPSCIIHPSIHPPIHPSIQLTPNPPFPSFSATLIPIPLILRSPQSGFYSLIVLSVPVCSSLLLIPPHLAPDCSVLSCPSLIHRNGPSHCRLSLVIPFPLQAWVGFTFNCLLLLLLL